MNSEVWSFSAVGQDRPGIVAAISKLLFEQDCNLSDSSMTILAGQFAVVLIFETGEKTQPDKLEQALSELGKPWHLQVIAAPVEKGSTVCAQQSGECHLVSVYGADQTGLTWKVAEKISAHGYNVTDLSTKKVEGSAPVYILLLEIEAGPEAKETKTLESDLHTLGQELGCSVTLKPVESSEF